MDTLNKLEALEVEGIVNPLCPTLHKHKWAQ